MCAREGRLLQPVSGALAQLPTAALLPARPSVSSSMLGSPLPGWRLDSDGCFPIPCCLAPWRSKGSMRCNPITSSPWGKERREEACQKTENKRLSNRLQQNREFHEGMLNLVAPWQNARLCSHCLPECRGPEPVGSRLWLIVSVHVSKRHYFRFSLESNTWQRNGLHHVFFKLFFKTKRIVCLFFPPN